MTEKWKIIFSERYLRIVTLVYFLICLAGFVVAQTIRNDLLFESSAFFLGVVGVAIIITYDLLRIVIKYKISDLESVRWSFYLVFISFLTFGSLFGILIMALEAKSKLIFIAYPFILFALVETYRFCFLWLNRFRLIPDKTFIIFGSVGVAIILALMILVTVFGYPILIAAPLQMLLGK